MTDMSATTEHTLEKKATEFLYGYMCVSAPRFKTRGPDTLTTGSCSRVKKI